MMERFADAPSGETMLRQQQQSSPAAVRSEPGRWLCRKFTFLCPGWPWTADERRLSDMISELTRMTELRTGVKLTSAIIAVPGLPSLKEISITHAASRSGLDALSTPWHIGEVTQISAAYAGSGHGLCQNYTDIDICEDEMYELAPAYVLGVHFDRGALRVVRTYMQHAVSFLFSL